PFLYKLVPTLVNEMGDVYPEIGERSEHVQNVIKAEEESFLRTLDTGLDLFGQVAKKVKAGGSKVIPGDEVFRLYDTYGFPYDLTEIIAGEQGLTLDRAGFDTAMSAQQERSKAASGFAVADQEQTRKLVDKLRLEGLEQLPATEFVREDLKIEADLILAAYEPWPHVALVLDRSPFYIESGGQIGDTGRIYTDALTVDITQVVNHQNRYVHIGKVVEGHMPDMMPVRRVTAEVDQGRRWDIMRNHTATHLAHAALRQVLGDHVKQSGSYVGPDRLRFDFSHHQPMTPEEIARVEEIVNERILKARDVETRLMDVDAAKAEGAVALFGEKYGDTVRVVSVPGFSKELCGGTHVHNVSQIGPFFISLETGIASGVRRLEAITGREAQKVMLNSRRFVQKASQLVGRPEAEALDGLEQLKQQTMALQKELKKTKAEMVAGKGQSVGSETVVGPVSLWTNDFGETDRDTLSAWIDNRKELAQPIVVLAIGTTNGKPTVMLAASSRAVKEQNIHVGNIAKELLRAFGGRGGGKPNFAQGGVPEGTNAQDVFDKAEQLLKEQKG
ncbi:MAG: alanine--tRNA ligase, partial [candidate division Zixibacteria bacterium]|nr:alanine--tRNA ligase [candidate division Zixibacteria bacterium]